MDIPTGSENVLPAAADAEFYQTWTASALDQMQEAVLAADLEGKVVYLNRAAERLTGWTLPGAVGRSLEEICPLRLAVRGSMLRTLSGEDHPVESSRSSIIDRHGTLRGSIVTLRDIAAELRTEDELRSIRNRHDTLVARSADGIWCGELERPLPVTLSEDEQIAWMFDWGYFSECNDAAARMYGFESAAEMIGRRLGEFLLRDDPRNVQFLRAFIRNGYRIADAESVEAHRLGGERIISNEVWGVVEGGFLHRAWGIQRDITEWKRVEEALRQSERILRNTADSAPVMIWTAGPDKHIDYFNRPWFEFTGRLPEEQLGFGWATALHPEDSAATVQVYETCFDAQKPFQMEYRLRRFDGDYRWILDSAVPRFSPTGEFLGFIGACVDVTERRQAEEWARMLALVLDSTTEGVSLSSELGFLLYTNPAQNRMSGYAPGELQAMHLSILGESSADGQRPGIWEVVQQMNGRASWSGEIRSVRRDGSVFPAFARLIFIDINGRCYWAVIQEDISERERAREQLVESEHRFRQLAENIREVFYISEQQENRMLYVSRTYEEIWGRSCESLYENPKSFLDGIHPDDRSKMIEAMALQQEGVETRVEYRVVRPDSSVRWILDRAFPIRDASGAVYRVTGVAEDITVQKEAAEALRTSEERLAVALRNAPLLLYTTDRERRYTWLHHPHRSFEVKDVLGKRDEEILPHSDIAELIAFKEDVLGSGVGSRREIRIRVGDVEEFYDITAEPLRDSRGEVTGLTVAALEITERARTEQALRESERQFRLLADSMPVMAWSATPDGVVDYYNRRWLEYTGLSTDDPDVWRKVLHPEDMDLCMEAWQRAIETSGEFEAEFRLRQGKSGRCLWHLGRAVPVLDESGKATRWFGTNTNIDERKCSEEEARANDIRLRFALEAGRLGDWDLDLVTRQATRSLRHDQIFGYQALLPEWSYEIFLSHVLPEDRPRVDQSFGQALRTGKDWSFEARIRRADGAVRWIWAAGLHIKDHTGRSVRMIGLVSDITERMELFQREQEARSTAELLNRIVPILSAELDLRRLAQKVTDLATQVTGAEFGVLFYPSKEGEDSAAQIVIVSGSLRTAIEPWARARMKEPGRTGIQAPVRIADLASHEPESRPAVPELGIRSYLAVPVISRSGERLGDLIFGHRDADKFTDRHEQIARGIAAQAAIAMDNARLFDQVHRERQRAEAAQQALIESNRALRRANEDLNQFAYSASHDLQEPLRMVSIYSQLLKRRYAGRLDAQADEFIGYTVRGAQRMEMLVRDLLAYTRAADVGEEEGGLVDCNTILERTLANLQAAIADAEAVVTTTALPVVRAHEVHLMQLFQNLISNAIKYRSERTPRIDVSAVRQEDEWVFSVRDNGIGIDPRYGRQIFGIFKRLHGAGRYPGTGIGLAICQKIVERYGGRIWVESEVGSGSTFYFTLPVFQAAESA